jgi:8-oxo-dGTP pyrophosphatase MutT (NUDIX family)
MDKITFVEFGVTSTILKHHKISIKLKGMRNGKPFTSEDKILINIGEELHEVDSIEFTDSEGARIDRKDVRLDTEKRISGIIYNSSEVLLLKNVSSSKEFYCFPGGHNREGESEIETLEREMLEETGIDIKGSKITLLKKIHQQGFGPESFYLINFGSSKINFKDESGTEMQTALEIIKIKELKDIDNLYPKVITALLSQLF